MLRSVTITRRTCLRGLGLAMALPWLEQHGWGEEPAGAARVTTPPRRLCYVTFPNGTIRDHWHYSGQAIDGSDGKKVPRILEPLRPHFADVLVLHGLSHPPADSGPDGSGDHARGVATLLSGLRVRKGNTGHEVGVSADQLVARHVGHLTPLPSLELSLEGALGGGICDNGYPCAYMSHVSWRTPTQPMAKEVNPKAAFLRLFTDQRQEANTTIRAARRLEDASLLDLVREEAGDLRRSLGVADGRKVDEYLESVRAVEARIQAVNARSDARADDSDGSTRAAGERIPDQVPKKFADHARLMFDIVALAFQTDTTRVATVMLGNASSNRVFPELGVNSSHHELTHHGGDKFKKEGVTVINTHQVAQFAYLLERLKAVQEGGSRLLDHCLLFYGSGIGDGHQHNHLDLPILVAGRGGGTLRPGRVMQRTGGTLNDLHLGILQRMGLPLERFADSTTPLAELG